MFPKPRAPGSAWQPSLVLLLASLSSDRSSRWPKAQGAFCSTLVTPLMVQTPAWQAWFFKRRQALDGTCSTSDAPGLGSPVTPPEFVLKCLLPKEEWLLARARGFKPQTPAELVPVLPSEWPCPALDPCHRSRLPRDEFFLEGPRLSPAKAKVRTTSIHQQDVRERR